MCRGWSSPADLTSAASPLAWSLAECERVFGGGGLRREFGTDIAPNDVFTTGIGSDLAGADGFADSFVIAEPLPPSDALTSPGPGFTFDGGSAVYTNNTTSTTPQAGIYNNGSSPTLIDCTFGDNIAEELGGAVSNHTFVNINGAVPSNPAIRNCILWDNSPDAIFDESDNNPPSESTVSFSNVQGGWLGTGKKPNVVVGLHRGQAVDVGVGETVLTLLPRPRAIGACIDATLVDAGEP